jgi:hypothetical protein
VLENQPALEWDLTDAKFPSFRGLEVVSVVHGTGWTLQLDDDASTYAANLDAFRSMLLTFHFR